MAFKTAFAHHRYKLIAAAAALVLLGSAGIWVFIEFDLFHRIMALINEKTPAGLFISLMAVLPLVGAPLSLFLFFLGVKFGLAKGLLLVLVMMPFHLLVAYFLSWAVRRPLVKYLVDRKNYQIPVVPENKAFIFSFLFLTFPVFPYVVKLYMLPLAGVPFRYCFWLNWGVQGIMCIPFVLLGRSAADLNLWLFGAAAAAFAVLYLFLRWAKTQYMALQENPKKP